jgi:hypothetical protein
MKRYLVFFGNDYYPSGGMMDLVASCDTIDDCLIALQKSLQEKLLSDWADCWGHVFDTSAFELREVQPDGTLGAPRKVAAMNS